jgi:hypothetical protein
MTKVQKGENVRVHPALRLLRKHPDFGVTVRVARGLRSRKGDRSLLVPGSTGRSNQLSYFRVTLTRGMDDCFSLIGLEGNQA